MMRAFSILSASAFIGACTGPGINYPPKLYTPVTAAGVEAMEPAPYVYDPNLVAVSRELDDVAESIDEARDAGQLSKKEVRNARKQLGAIAREASNLSVHGLSNMEANSLETSARGVESVVNAPLIPN